MKVGKYKINKPVNVNMLAVPFSYFKKYWYSDFANSVHFTNEEIKKLDGLVGWGCALFSLIYILKDFGFVVDIDKVVKVVEDKYPEAKNNGLLPEQIVEIAKELDFKKIARIKTRLEYAGRLGKIQNILKNSKKRIFVAYWDDTFHRGYVSPDLDYGHYAPVIAVKDGGVVVASSGYRNLNDGYGLVGIPYKLFKRIHCDYAYEENAIDSHGEARPGLTWYVGLVVVVELNF